MSMKNRKRSAAVRGLRRISQDMMTIAPTLEGISKFHADELRGASRIMLDWSEEIESEIEGVE